MYVNEWVVSFVHWFEETPYNCYNTIHNNIAKATDMHKSVTKFWANV